MQFPRKRFWIPLALTAMLPLLMGPTGGLPSIFNHITIKGIRGAFCATCSPLDLSSTDTGITLDDTDAAANFHKTRMFATNTKLCFDFANDANSVNSTILCATRGAASILSVIDIGNVTDNAPVNFLGTGTVSFSGPLSSSITTPTFGSFTTTGADGRLHLVANGHLGDFGVDANGAYVQGESGEGIRFYTSSTLRGTWASGGILDFTVAPTVAGVTLVTETTGTFAPAFGGFAAPPSATASWTKHGNIVTLTFPLESATSNATTFNMTNLPAAIIPASSQTVALMVIDNSNSGLLGTFNLTGASSTVSFGLYSSTSVATRLQNTTGAIWTAAGNKGITATTVVYSIQ